LLLVNVAETREVPETVGVVVLVVVVGAVEVPAEVDVLVVGAETVSVVVLVVAVEVVGVAVEGDVLVVAVVRLVVPDPSYQQDLSTPTAGSPNTALPHATDVVNVPTTELVSVPYLTLRVPLNVQVPYS
jgi:hypothetical protein